MTTLSTSKEQNSPTPVTQTMQLYSTHVTTRDLDNLNYNKSKNVTVPIYPRIHEKPDVLACSVNLSKHNNGTSSDMAGTLDTPQSSESQSNEFSFYKFENTDKTESKNCNVYDWIDRFPTKSFKQSYKTIASKEGNECPQNTSDSFYIGSSLNSAQGDNSLNSARGSNSLEANFSDSVNGRTISCKPKGVLAPSERNLSPSKHTDNQPNQVKTKLRSIWNNMKYGWRVKRECNLKVDSAAWLLGRCYHNKLNDGSVLSEDVSKQLKIDLLSKIWLTYRINFPTIPGTEFESDSGWGCMLRCGQMMMAQALVCHFLHRDWRISSYQPEETKYLYKMILRWFGDSLSDTSPFSLHHLVSLGKNYGRKPGDWYGPTHAAQVLRDALFRSYREHPQLENVCMYVALDGIVFKQDIMDLCSKSPIKYECPNMDQSTSIGHAFSSDDFAARCPNTFQENSLQDKIIFRSTIAEGYANNFEEDCPSYSEFGPPSFGTSQKSWRSLILFVSVRLGNDKVNPFYIPCLKSLLAYEHCIGIIGGRPKHALYFIGWQEDKLIHLDPHSCQPAVDVEKEDFNGKSFHSSSIRTISFSEMDPSCAIGFYFRKKEEFEYFVEKFSEIITPMKRNLDYPVFALAEGRRIDVEEVDSYNTYARSSLSNRSNTSYKEDDDDDYILL